MFRCVTNTYRPSDRMVAKFAADAARHAQDQTIILPYEGGITAAIVDGANNFIGRTHYPSPCAVERGLPADTELNGGEIVSSLLPRVIAGNPNLTGLELVLALNAELAREYVCLGLLPHMGRRGELFTGYVGHVRVTEDTITITITAVGDCYIALNGKLVAGVEKDVDRLYRRIREHAVILLCRQNQEVYAALMPTLVAKQFDFQNNFDGTDVSTARFHLELPQLVSVCLKISLKQAKEIVDLAISDVPHTLSYPAIDGTVGQVVDGSEIPAEGIEFYKMPRQGIYTIALWTDGYEPVGQRVLGLDDLKLASPEFGEAAAIVLIDS